jgi:hypothetical protein
MFDFLTSWYGLLLGGGLTTFIVLVVALRWAGVSAEPLVLALSPIFKSAGEIVGNAMTVIYENVRDGLLYIGKSGKALLALVVVCGMVAGVVYVPTKQRAEKRGAERQVKELRKKFRFVDKTPKAPKQYVPAMFGYGGR